MAAHPLDDWNDLVPANWYELRADDELAYEAQCIGPYEEKRGSAPFLVDGRYPDQRFWSKKWTATPIQKSHR